MIVSPALLRELACVLARPKFRRWLAVEEVNAFVRTLRVGATLIDDPPPQRHSVRDPDDYYLLTLASSADADYLVPGDADLTSMQNTQPPVITPSAFLATLDTRG